MICKISIILLVVMLWVSIDAKSYHGQHDLELSNDEAKRFLHRMTDDDDEQDNSLDKRESGKNCVPCKFKINPCCAPNICLKKFPWNECMEIKTQGIGK